MLESITFQTSLNEVELGMRSPSWARSLLRVLIKLVIEKISWPDLVITSTSKPTNPTKRKEIILKQKLQIQQGIILSAKHIVPIHRLVRDWIARSFQHQNILYDKITLQLKKHLWFEVQEKTQNRIMKFKLPKEKKRPATKLIHKSK